ncbi:glycyl radical protein [Marinilabiliaceae bacterium JC017]|nr:glycyl radical protein [Marinilabiliaceae bacterium JC017]
MNDRIKKLRQQTLEAVNSLSEERALLLTEFYQSSEAREISAPVRRAMSFKYILSNKYINILDGELIVGERGPSPKATPTYPEVSLHTLEDLEVLDQRPKVSFKVDEKMKKDYEETIIPYWKGKSNRDKIMALMSPEWKNAYEAGVFTEFQEQRAPGHTVADGKLYRKGMLDFKAEIQNGIDAIDFFNDPQAYDKLEELKAMDIAADAIIGFAQRHADKLTQLANDEQDSDRKKELEEMAVVCRNVPANAPKTFHEALQYYWFVHLGVITEVNPWDSFNPGRLDQHLYPFYVRDIKEGRLTKEQAKELLMSFWVKFNNQPAPPKMGVTAKESNTYTDFALINVGGVKTDGSDAVNELSFLILDVIEEMRLLQPSSMAQVSKKNPDRYIHRVLQITKTGFGQPSIFNTDAIVQELLRQGKSLEDSRDGGASGCVETGAFGKEAYWLTGYFNLSKVLEITLHNGTDPRTGKKIGIETGDPASFESLNDLMEAYKKQVNYFIDIKIEGNNKIESIIGRNLPVPFLSIIIDDCIAQGRDYNAGGARYNTSYIQGVGMGTITDSLTAIKYHVYDKNSLTLDAFVKVLDDNFEGHEALRYDLINNTPKYGNDDDYADDQAREVFEIFYNAVNGRPTARGGAFRINLLPTTSHVYFGQVMLASTDGRKAGEALSEGISPVQGADRKGPTAVINTMSKIDHLRTGGTLLNMKFAPQFFEGTEGVNSLTQLIRSYFRMDGHHIQFNVVNADTLRKAQKHPEKYGDLIVRVAGYSDYFNDLTPELQEEIIRRTEYENF